MKLLLASDMYTKKSTTSVLSIDGAFECYTLEDVVRFGSKVYGQTAIPTGVYKIHLDFSHKYKKVMPHVMGVPGFEGIRIHSGNKSDDTEGCLLVGTGRSVDWIAGSRIAYSRLYTKLDKARQAGEDITIEIARAGAK